MGYAYTGTPLCEARLPLESVVYTGFIVFVVCGTGVLGSVVQYISGASLSWLGQFLAAPPRPCTVMVSIMYTFRALAGAAVYSSCTDICQYCFRRLGQLQLN